MDNLKKAIIKTLAYFDIHDRPLTREELYKWLWQYPGLNYLDFLNSLEKYRDSGILGYEKGLYFLPDRGQTPVEKHLGSHYIVKKKMEIAKRAAKKIRYIPFVEAMFVCNTVALSTAKQNSDIDVFIVVESGRLWLTRLLVTVWLTLFRLRRDNRCVADKICLSFYTTDEALDLSDLKIDETDVYLTYWVAQLMPVYDPKNIIEKISWENKWVKNFLPQADIENKLSSLWSVIDTKFSRGIKRFFEIAWQGLYGDILEKKAREIQRSKMDKNYTSKENDNKSGVIINDSMLKFHENDRRQFFLDTWERRCKTFGIDS